MDSPVRKQQKRNDYLRHKMFRKINRRKKAEKELAKEAPMKEMRRRLRRRGLHFEDGKDEGDSKYIIRTNDGYDHDFHFDPNTGLTILDNGTVGTMRVPDVEVVGQAPRPISGVGGTWETSDRIIDQKKNAAEREYARRILDEQTPNILNLADAFWHWWNGVPGLGAENYSYDEEGNKVLVNGGTVPVPGSIDNGINVMKTFKQIRSLKDVWNNLKIGVKSMFGRNGLKKPATTVEESVAPVERFAQSVERSRSPQIKNPTTTIEEEWPFPHDFKNWDESRKFEYITEKKVDPKYGIEYIEVKPQFRKFVKGDDRIGLSLHADHPTNSRYWAHNFFSKDKYYKETKLLPSNRTLEEFLGEAPIKKPADLNIKKFQNDWTGWEDYRDLVKARLWEDWNNNGPLRSHLERSGINNPEVLLDYIVSPETAWKESLSNPGFDLNGIMFKNDIFTKFLEENEDAMDFYKNSIILQLYQRYPEILTMLQSNPKLESHLNNFLSSGQLAETSNALEKLIKAGEYSKTKGVPKIIDFLTIRRNLFKLAELELYLGLNKETLKKLYSQVDKLYDNAFKSNKGFLYVPINSSNGKINLEKFYTEVLSHEFGHLEDLSPSRLINEVNGIIESTLNSIAPSSDSPLFKKAFDISKSSNERYFGGLSDKDATEMAQRATQIKDYYRLKPGLKLTMELLKNAAEHYVKDVIDNNMTEFFNTIIDWDAALLWINTHGKAVIPVSAAGYATYKSSENDSSDRKYNLGKPRRGGRKLVYDNGNSLPKFKQGKGISDELYYRIMERVAEENNPIWNELRIKEGYDPLSVEEDLLRILNDNTYDYRGYYNEYPNGDGNALDHWTDEFKTVWHPSFSTLSKYSGKISLYNPYGILGGQWNGENYVPAWGLLLPPNIKTRSLFEYKKGKSRIYIKPENRGKFNALKKRTGKTTEQLTHSKNPLTRKRAIFSLNAKKWHHKK